jgi:hypothetical protein
LTLAYTVVYVLFNVLPGIRKDKAEQRNMSIDNVSAHFVIRKYSFHGSIYSEKYPTGGNMLTDKYRADSHAEQKKGIYDIRDLDDIDDENATNLTHTLVLNEQPMKMNKE